MSTPYVIGIDLGTTNSALAYAREDSPRADFPVPQLVAPGAVETRPTLPSFLYLPGPHDLPPGATALPWEPRPQAVAGWLAREQAARVPQRVISSAKSWLCNELADRRGPILPWQAPDEVPRRSPVQASAAYLEHLRQAWNQAHPEAFLEDQEVVLTVPASFDAVARQLTAEAAEDVGLPRLTLLEEPQAAFYAWLDQKGEAWRQEVGEGDRVLVIDIGGGTTDFTLIAVTQEEGNLVLERVAVGDHLMLGGDNLDLALATSVQTRLRQQGTRLDGWQMQALVHACRVAKERLLSGEEVESLPLVIPGRGSALVGGSIRAELSRGDVEQAVLEGFFPLVEVSEVPAARRRLGLAELGLPFEADPAITRHLGRFLSLHRQAVEGPGGWTFAHPTAVLFNGGVLKAPRLRQRLAEVLNRWLEAEGSPPVRLLEASDLDLAVARGAAVYGLVRRGRGIRIRGGTSRAYYIGVEVARPAVPGLPPPVKAVCVAPQGMEEGTRQALEGRDFGLVVGEESEFRFLGSSLRPEDRIGDVVEDWEEEIQEIATLATTLPAGEGATPGTLVPVQLESVVTEVGTLEIWCRQKDGPGRWKLEFEVREKPAAAS
jgi:molecular chaperone DnaK (HSP70)